MVVSRSVLLVVCSLAAACSSKEEMSEVASTGEQALVTAQTDEVASDALPSVLSNKLLWVRPGPSGRREIVTATIGGPAQVVFQTPPSMIGPVINNSGVVQGHAYFRIEWAESIGSGPPLGKHGVIETDGTAAGTRVVNGAFTDLPCGNTVYSRDERLNPGLPAPLGLPPNVQGVFEAHWCVGDQAMVVSTRDFTAGVPTERFYRWEEDGSATLLALPPLPDYPTYMRTPFALYKGQIVPLYALWPGPQIDRYTAPDASSYPELSEISRFVWERRMTPIGIVQDTAGNEKIAFTVDNVAFGTTDGTIAGTHLHRALVDRWHSIASVQIAGGTARGIFYDGAGRGLFESDGSPAGTAVREPLLPAPFAPFASYLFTRRSASEWVLLDPTNANKTLTLWSTDWTSAGTQLIGTANLPDAATKAFSIWNGYSSVARVVSVPGGVAVLYNATTGIRLLRLSL